ncbi:hypothetical protein D3C83_266350 [compost metagenome]
MVGVDRHMHDLAGPCQLMAAQVKVEILRPGIIRPEATHPLDQTPTDHRELVEIVVR